MRRFELGMSLDYVENWSPDKAINEIFQNALDEEIQNPENKWYFNYNEDTQTLKIGNKLSRLATKSLLLGCSSKRDDASTIGQHGEGYKVATIVLLRCGCGIKVYNYNEKEIWTAKVIKSRRYGTEIGVFDVEKMGIFKSVPEHSLVFEITNITKEIYESVKMKNLWLQEDLGEVIESKHGRVLLDDRFAGKVFVKGLYVCDKEQLTYGYDLAPDLISLDRDRGLVDSFNLQYQLGKLLLNIEDTEFIKKVKDKWDGYYIRCFAWGSDVRLKEVYTDALEKFTKKYGEDAYPCINTDEFNRLKRRGYNVAMVTENEHYYITHAEGYSPVVSEDDDSVLDDLKAWFEKTKDYLPEELIKEGSEIIDEVSECLD